jgi:hypothetical protein
VKFHSQIGQDRFLLEHFFRGRRGGVFVDIGAYDREMFSNTLFFERSMGWRGLCVEPLPSAFTKLSSSASVTQMPGFAQMQKPKASCSTVSQDRMQRARNFSWKQRSGFA